MAQASHGSLLDALGVRIVDGDLPPGSVMTLADIEESYEASRTVVREAIRVLEAMGLVVSKPRIGVTVRPTAMWNALDPQLIDWQLAGSQRDHQIAIMTEFRAAVEPLAARLSARRATAPQREEILALAHRLDDLSARNLGGSTEFLEVDISFHRLILFASGNPMLAATRDAVAEILIGRAKLRNTPVVRHNTALHNHMEVATAIAQGDADAAEQHARGYVNAVLADIASSSA